MPNFPHSKNIVYQSAITAGGDVHIGDKQITQNAEKIYNIEKLNARIRHDATRPL
jgi:hypothetical protein